jgi:hypothetical protein
MSRLIAIRVGAWSSTIKIRKALDAVPEDSFEVVTGELNTMAPFEIDRQPSHKQYAGADFRFIQPTAFIDDPQP